MSPATRTRRQILAGALSAGVAALAGCRTGDSTADGTPEVTSGSPTTTPGATSETASPTPGETTTATAEDAPVIDHPDEVLVDERFTLATRRPFDAGELGVSIETDDADGTTWSVSGIFDVTGNPGSLDEATLVGGDVPSGLSVPNTMALLQFLAPEGEMKRYAASTPETLTVTATVDGTQVATSLLTRFHGTPGVTERTIDHDLLAGRLYEPPGDGPHPGVIVLHASDGRPDRFMATMLATHGYTSLALRYFGEGAPTEALFEVPLDYVDTAGAWLSEHDSVTGNTLGLVGDSKGGELALLAGSEFDWVGPVVSLNGSGVVWSGFAPGGELNAGSSWSREGDDVPYVPYVEDDDLWRRRTLEPAYTASLNNATAEEIEAATIPVENIDGPVLLVSGRQDAVWDAVRLQGIVADRGDADLTHLVYEDAGHLVTIPYRPVAGFEKRTPLTVGGTPSGQAEASADYWPRLLDTLRALG